MGFGYGADMSRFAPKAHLTASLDLWGPYYISRAKAALDGTWKPDDTWWGMKEGILGMAPYSKAVPDNVRGRRRQDHRRLRRTEAMTSSPAPSPTSPGKERVPAGRAHEGRRHAGDGLVRQGRAELILEMISDVCPAGTGKGASGARFLR